MEGVRDEVRSLSRAEVEIQMKYEVRGLTMRLVGRDQDSERRRCCHGTRVMMVAKGVRKGKGGDVRYFPKSTEVALGDSIWNEDVPFDLSVFVKLSYTLKNLNWYEMACNEIEG